jgi:hypothetical protein
MKRHSRLNWDAVMGGITLVVLAAGCLQRPQPPAAARGLLRKAETGAAKRQAVQAEYGAMTVPQLVNRLEADAAKDVEPFNSLAYRELVSRGPQVGKELASFIKAPDRTSFLTLLALRKVHTNMYRSVDRKVTVRILIDALRTSKYFNTWGLPHLYWEDAAKAIMEQGNSAVEPLRALLQDKREAPVWGSEEVMEYRKFKYRVCDYAWALLMEIKRGKVAIPVDPLSRDERIAAVLKEGG